MILSDLLCCWPAAAGRPSEKETAAAATSRSLSAPATSELCIFCNPSPDKFDIIIENERCIVFTDRSPAAQHHLLAVPRAHIPNVKSLSGEHGADVVKELQRIGRQALAIVSRTDPFADPEGSRVSSLSSNEPKETRYGFHIPPFRSVDHLHLHCLALPFKSTTKALKYRVAPGDGTPAAPHKGWGWFVTAEQAMSILRDGAQVGVKPC